MKKYAPEELEQMGQKADDAVTNTTVIATGLGFVPIGFDLAVFATTVGAGVVAVGRSYDFTVSKGEAGELIKEFMKAAGLTFMFLTTGTKLVTSLLKSNPLSYWPTAITDAALCGGTAYSLCSTAKGYFQKKAEGKKATQEDIKQWMAEGKIQGKKIAKRIAVEKAKEKKAECETGSVEDKEETE